MKYQSILLLLMFYAMQASSQQGMTNTGFFQVHPGGAVTLFGSFDNTASSGWINHGTVYLKSDFSNHQPLMLPGSGTLYLNGTTRQVFGGTQPYNAFHLTTSNVQGFMLNSNISVAGNHLFGQGIIASSGASTFLVYGAGATYSGESDGAHVSGWVKKIGNSDFSFPVGNGTFLRKTAITNLSALSEFTARYGQNTPNQNSMDLSLVVVNSNEYWEIIKISGGTAQVTLNWDNSRVGFPNYVLTDITTAQLIGGQWTSTGGNASGNVATTGMVTSNVLSSFGNMVIGSRSFVLPVHFLSIAATRMAGYTNVQWRTIEESNVKNFEVQRTTEQGFMTIAAIGAKNTLQEQSYIFPDSAALSGRVYYRIKSVDHDERVHYSGIASVQIHKASKISMINPVVSKIQLITDGLPPSKGQYKIFTESGQVVASGTVQLGNVVTEIALAPFAQGTYIFLLQYGSEQFSSKFTRL
jgi:hypothetical protein